MYASAPLKLTLCHSGVAKACVTSMREPAIALPTAAYCVLGVGRTLTDSTQLTMVALVLVVGSSST